MIARNSTDMARGPFGAFLLRVSHGVKALARALRAKRQSRYQLP